MFSLWRLYTDSIENGLELSALHAHAIENLLTEDLRVAEYAATNAVGAPDEVIDIRAIEKSFGIDPAASAISCARCRCWMIRHGSLPVPIPRTSEPLF
jgi:uncharacterized protein (DUF111 family)